MQQQGRTPVYLASSPDPEGISGKYFSNCRERQPDAAAQDDEAAARLRRESERLIGL
jgi:retinol dehydrogenase 12